MSYPINYPTPQGANVQIFNGQTSDLTATNTFSWTKPQGASFVWFTLIGAGGTGNGTTGGASGAVTNFMCPAFLIPNNLRVQIQPALSSTSTKIRYQEKTSAGYDLLTANNGVAGVAGTAMTANAFTAIGFFQSVAGMNGQNANVSVGDTFLTGGGSLGGNSSCAYDYSSGPASSNRNGFFQTQPIIMGTSGMGTGRGGIGCGGGLNSGSGGNGMVVIITW